MVQKYQSPVRVYKHPFELVIAAYERRFPTCELIPILVGADVVNETHSKDGAVSVVERRCKLNVDIPYLLKKIIGVDYAYFIQTNSLDRRKRQLRIEAHNESFASRIVVNESCIYYVHPENSTWTCFEQSGTLDIKSFFGFETTVEKIAVKQYSQNIAKGKEIIDFFIKQLRDEGIESVPQFQGVAALDGDGDDGGGGSDGGGGESSGRSTGSPAELRLGATAASLQHAGLLSAAEPRQFALEADYIQRTLGHLTPLQESRLLQLRQCVAELHKGKVPADAMLLRFLRAREFGVEKAREMLCQSLVWRKKHQIDRLLDDYRPPQVVVDYFGGSWHGSDRDGRPMYVLRLGQLDVKGLIKSIGDEGLLKLSLAICEEGLRRCDEATLTLGRPVQTWTLLVDLDELTMRHLWRPGIQTLLRITEVVEANYPETLGRVLVTRAPRVFPILWTVISTFIDEVTRSKILFHAGADGHVAGGLADIIGADNVPDFLGGPAESRLCAGGLVPKTLYMTESACERDRLLDSPTLCEDSIYKCVTLSKGQVHEVLVENKDVGSVLCWDFDVMRHDVVFSLYRTKWPVATPRSHAPTACGASESPSAAVAAAAAEKSDADPHRSLLDKSWKEGVDYFLAEPSCACHDGESIQGSHLTTHQGTYLLQWRLHESAGAGGALGARDIIDTLTAHGAKAKLMYFYETLSSDDYKGSMTSLRSGHSGFSTLTSISAAGSVVSR